MFNICSPRKDNCFLWVHSKCNGLIARDIRIAYKEGAALQRVPRYPPHPCVFVRFHDKVITPRHRQNWMKSAQHGKKSTILYWPGVDQIGLDLLGQTSKVQGQM